MMTGIRSLKVLLVLLILSVLISPVFAQELTATTYLAEDESFIITYSDDWEFLEDMGNLLLFNAAVSITIYGPSDLSGIIPADATRLVALEAFAEAQELETRYISAFGLGERFALRGELDAGFVLAVGLSDGNIGILVIEGELDEAIEEAILAVVQTFDSPTFAAAIIPCVVSSDQDNTVSLRVGPGINRGVIAFLPGGADFDVVGEAEANDGSLWWKLDKEQVAPGSDASELWVAQEDVTATGDCDLVSKAEAPPLVPIEPGEETTDQ